jgi:hypothetical protein
MIAVCVCVCGQAGVLVGRAPCLPYRVVLDSLEQSIFQSKIQINTCILYSNSWWNVHDCASFIYFN